MNCIIVDDEPLAREAIQMLIDQTDNLDSIGSFNSPDAATNFLANNEVDLIFLDIQMPKLNGFEMLELLEDPPIIIFTTAYDHYAIKAFEVSAIDYLLKPFSEERFTNALQKAISQLGDRFQQNSAIQNIIKQRDEKIEFLERVVIKDSGKITIIPVEEIKWIEAQDDYVLINSEKGRFLKQKTMKYFENHLNENQFVRIHRSYIINLDFLQHLEQTDTESYRLVLKNGKELPVSKTGLTKLKSTL